MRHKYQKKTNYTKFRNLGEHYAHPVVKKLKSISVLKLAFYANVNLVSPRVQCVSEEKQRPHAPWKRVMVCVCVCRGHICFFSVLHVSAVLLKLNLLWDYIVCEQTGSADGGADGVF